MTVSPLSIVVTRTPEPPPGPPRPRLVRDSASPAPSRRWAPPPEQTLLEATAHRCVRAFVEVVEGVRPVQQLARSTTPLVLDQLRQRVEALPPAPTSGRRVHRARVASIRISRPGPGAAEIAARVVHGDRSRALAARLEQTDDRWRCCALVWG